MSRSTFISTKSSKSNITTPLMNIISQGRPKFISLIFTESISSALNVKTQHLQDIQENVSKSKICILVGNSHDGKEDIQPEGKLPISDNVALYRVVSMEESSTSVYEMDDLSICSFEKYQTEDQQDSPLYLGQQIVKTSPLMAICSTAHDGNLYAELNKIYVKVQNTDLPLSSSGWVNMCRICHGSDSLEELIGPCRCKGSVALAHLSCLERWLRESSRSHCELCLHHYEIQREPKYSLLKSILVWVTTPGDHRAALLEDLLSFGLYSPAAICSTYILMIIGEFAAKNYEQNAYGGGQFVMFLAVLASVTLGIAAIDFTYSSWLMMRLQYHMQIWRQWYRENCCLTLLLPPRKRRRRTVSPEPFPAEQTTAGN